MMLFRQSRIALILVFLLLVPAGYVLGQTAMATARGTITDEQGAVLPGVAVTVRHLETNVTRTAVSSETGKYLMPNLPPGSYEVTAELTGFTAAKRTATLRVGQESTLDFTMGVGPLEESITVSGLASLVETQHSVGTHLDTKQIDDLPTLTRDFADLAKLAPGVTTRGAAGSGFSAAGARQYQNNIVVDGSTNVMQFYGTQADLYPQDWVREFEVMTGGASAEFGQAIGGIVNVVTRSGSNDFTGRVYSYFRDDKFDSPPFAGTFVNNEPQFLEETPPFNQQRVGAFAGGPILRDKMFYFAGVENLENTATRVLSISPYWRTNGGPGSGGVAGQSNGPNGHGFEATVPTKNVSRAFLVKADWNLKQNHALTVRHNRTIKEDTNCTGQGGDGCAGDTLAVLEKSSTFEGPIWSLMGNLTSTLGTTSFNEARVYFGVNKLFILGNKSGGLYGRSLIEQNADGKFSQSTYPGVAIGQTTTSGLEGEHNLYFTDNFTFVRGNHQFKVGGDVARVKIYMDIDASHKGRWSFPEDRVFDLADARTYPDTFSGAVGFARWIQPDWNFHAFAQDSWQVTSGLTLNLGLRYDLDNTVQIGNDLIDAYNQRIIDRWGGPPVTGKIPRDANNLAPRAGFAWVPTESHRTVVRGSAGIFYDQNHFNYNDVYLNQTLLAERRVDFNANSSTANPFCTGGVVTADCRAQLRDFLARSYPAFPPIDRGPLVAEFFNGMSDDFRIPWTASFTGGVSHQLTQQLLVTADATFNRGEDIVLSVDKNIASIDPVTRRTTINDPRFNQIVEQVNEGWIHYSAFLTRIQWLRAQTRLGASYTLSKCTSNSSATGVGGGAATNPLDLSIDDGPCNEDRRHNFVVDGWVQFPWAFQASAIYRGASALPYSVTSRFVVFDRPEPRNSRRGDDEHNLDVRVSKEFRIGGPVRAAVFWEMFNTLNTRNFTSYQGSLEAFNFGQPRSVLPMRRQQLGFRVDF
jgi:hypothetical protein